MLGYKIAGLPGISLPDDGIVAYRHIDTPTTTCSEFWAALRFLSIPTAVSGTASAMSA